jgi:hypothetical protein
MSKLFDLNIYQDRVALISDDGASLSYGDMSGFSEIIRKQMSGRSLVFCLCRNTAGSLLGYVSFINNKQLSSTSKSGKDDAISGFRRRTQNGIAHNTQSVSLDIHRSLQDAPTRCKMMRQTKDNHTNHPNHTSGILPILSKKITPTAPFGTDIIAALLLFSKKTFGKICTFRKYFYIFAIKLIYNKKSYLHE